MAYSSEYRKEYCLAHKEQEKKNHDAWYVIYREEKLIYKKEYHLTHKEQEKAYRNINRDKTNAQRRERRRINKNNPEFGDNKYRLKNKNKVALQHKDYYQTIKFQVLSHYSIFTTKPMCAVPGCLVSDPGMLIVDHTNGNGNKHRKELAITGGGYAMYLWLIRNNFPPGFQVLCCNHNIKKELKNKPKNGIKNKLKVLSHYSIFTTSPMCSMPGCCISDLDMLCLDHINNNGAKHRKEMNIGSGIDTYRWLIKNAFPEGYQDLCWNHNTKKNSEVVV